MVNYQLGKIYKIVCNITDECYIGSTCQPSLAQRLSKHVSGYKRWKAGKISSKVSSYDIIGRGDYEILLVELVPCMSKDELISREKYFIRTHKMNCNCLNQYIPGRTPTEKITYSRQHYEINKDKHKEIMREWNKNNKDKMKEYNKLYRDNNKEVISIQRKTYRENNKDTLKERNQTYRENNIEQIKLKKSEKVKCLCGSSFVHCTKARHECTKKHQDYLLTIT